MSEQLDLSTSCKGCAFALLERKTQTDCSQGMLEKFRRAGTEVVEAYDEESEFFVIKGRQCVYRRPVPWGEGLSLAEAAHRARQEVALRVHAFILGTNHSGEDIASTAHSLAEQTGPPPLALTVIIAPPRPLLPEVVRALSKTLTNLPWNVHCVQEKGLSDDICLDQCLPRVNAPFYVVFQAGYEVPSTFTAELDGAVNDQLERFSLLLPKNGQGTVVQTLLHRWLGGGVSMALEGEEGGSWVRKFDSLADKLRFVADEQGLAHMVRSVEEVCPCLA